MNLVFKFKVLGFVLAIIAGFALQGLLMLRSAKTAKVPVSSFSNAADDDDLVY